MEIIIAFVVAVIVYVLGKALVGDRVPEPFIFAAAALVFLLMILGKISL